MGLIGRIMTLSDRVCQDTREKSVGTLHCLAGRNGVRKTGRAICLRSEPQRHNLACALNG